MNSATVIKELRLAKGMTQEELATRLGLQKAAIAKYEKGRVVNIKRSVVEKMAEIFGVEPAYILGFESDSTEPNPTYTVPSTAKVATTGGASRADGQQISFSSYIPKDSRASSVELSRIVAKLSDSEVNVVKEYAEFILSKRENAQEKLSV